MLPSPPELLTYRRGAPVYGYSYETGQLTDEIRAVKMGPGASRVFYANTVGNYLSAIMWRVLMKQQHKFAPTAEDVKRIKEVVEDMKTHIFTRKAVRHAITKMGGLIGIKSPKWSDERFWNAARQLVMDHNPHFKISGGVKNEPYKKGKPPRPIHADGDVGQLMAGIVMWVFDDILFHRLQKKTIKHVGKEAAMQRVCENLCLEAGQELIETDGSAWDATMSPELRDLIENPIVDHVMDQMFDLGFPYPPQWAQAHGKVNRQKKLSVTAGKSKAVQRVRVVFDAIRRSGHRGTSSLNWLVNFVLSHCAIMQNPTRSPRGGKSPGFLDPTTKWGIDRWGKRRQFAWSGEGDDGLTATHPKLNDQQEQDVVSFWTRMGVNCELVRCTRVATFVGWKIFCNEGLPVWELTGPDLPRTISNSAYTVSPSVLAEHRRGTERIVTNQVGAASYMAYAISVQRVAPTLAEVFRRMSEAYGHFNEEALDRDQRMKLGDTRWDGALSDWTGEEERLARLGLVPQGEYASFVQRASTIELDSPDELIDGLFRGYVQ